MSFLTPVFLFGLLAAAIPIAIHLIRRDKPPRIVFSTLRFFQRTSRKQFFFQKMQQWLLLLLRTLAVVLLVLAFARPFFGQSISNWAELAPRSVAVLVDTSMSMGYGDYLERARKAARNALAELNPGDEAALIFFSDTPKAIHGPTSDFSTLQAAIDGLEAPAFERTRYFPALRAADELLSDSRFEDQAVVLISDFQNSGMTGLDPNWKLRPGVTLTTESIADRESRNLAITGLKSPPYLRGGDVEDELYIRVRSLGSVRQEQAELAVTIDNQELWRKRIELEDQSETVVKVPVSFSGEGSHVGRVTVKDEHFPLDNDYWFTADVVPRIPVLTVNGDPSGNWFEDEAHWFGLAVSGAEDSPFSLTVVEQQTLDARRLQDHRVVALLNTGRITATQVRELEGFVREGGSLLIAPGNRVQAAAFNRLLARLSPAQLVQRGDLTGDDYLLIAEVNSRHPVLRPIQVDWGVRFTGYWQLKPADNTEVLMRFDNGDPAMVEHSLGEGRVLLLASSLDLEWNNLPLQGMYLPFIHESLKYLANTPEKKPFYLVGEQLPPTATPAGKLRSPQGDSLALGEGDGGFLLREPGIYSHRDEGATTYYAVNRPLEESDLATFAPAALVDQVLNPETGPVQSSEVRNQLMKLELEKPQRLWWWLLLVVALLLLSEGLLANRTYR